MRTLCVCKNIKNKSELHNTYQTLTLVQINCPRYKSSFYSISNNWIKNNARQEIFQKSCSRNNEIYHSDVTSSEDEVTTTDDYVTTTNCDVSDKDTPNMVVKCKTPGENIIWRDIPSSHHIMEPVTENLSSRNPNPNPKPNPNPPWRDAPATKSGYSWTQVPIETFTSMKKGNPILFPTWLRRCQSLGICQMGPFNHVEGVNSESSSLIIL